ncbi:MAG: CDP-alcohol phosphatidyltransferase family protein [bacterium]|nr:CDP-alcohol phosphatidyltransferase family protein [bacterium]
MIREAFILTAPGDAACRIAGIPLLLRTILVLQRAGIERCTVVGETPPPHDPRIRCTVTRAPVLAAPADAEPRLLVGAGSVLDETLVRDLQARAAAGDVVEVQAGGARVRVAPGTALAANGVAPRPPWTGILRPASGHRAATERALLRGLENPRDGYLDRVLHRRFSRPVTALLLHTPLTPNAVTVLGVLLGVAGGLALALPGPLAVIACVLGIVASGVLDCSDGELARLRFSESRLGHALDVAGDTLVHLALLGGIAMRLGAQGALPDQRWLVALGLGVLGAFVVITACEVTEDRRHRGGGWQNRIIDGVLSPLTTRDWYVFPLAFALLGRLDLLVPAAAVGAHVFWLVTLVLLAGALRPAATKGRAPHSSAE